MPVGVLLVALPGGLLLLLPALLLPLVRLLDLQSLATDPHLLGLRALVLHQLLLPLPHRGV